MNVERVGNDREVIRIYLADRDEPCPSCRYNLRGVDGTVCPECGEPLRVGMTHRAEGSGYRLFLLLAFGWVLAAAAMNAYRSGYGVYVRAASPPFNTQITGSIIWITPGARGSSFVLNGGSAGQPQVTVRNGFITTPTAQAGGQMNWTAVSVRDWVQLGWWTALAVGGLAGLASVVAHRHRLNSAAAPRRALVCAAALFALYAGFHLVLFTREIVGV